MLVQPHNLQVIVAMGSISTSLLLTFIVNPMVIVTRTSTVGLRLPIDTCPSRVLTIPKRKNILHVTNCEVR